MSLVDNIGKYVSVPMAGAKLVSKVAPSEPETGSPTPDNHCTITGALVQHVDEGGLALQSLLSKIKLLYSMKDTPDWRGEIRQELKSATCFSYVKDKWALRPLTLLCPKCLCFLELAPKIEEPQVDIKVEEPSIDGELTSGVPIITEVVDYHVRIANALIDAERNGAGGLITSDLLLCIRYCSLTPS